MNWNFIDTHAHLNLATFSNDIDNVVKECSDKEVAVINVGTKESTSEKAVTIASQYPEQYAIVGLHPIQTVAGDHDESEIGTGGQPFKSQGEKFRSDFYQTLAQSDRVVGIGECGFDYYHTNPDSHAIQEEAFIEQIKLANRLNKPLMIHTRGPKPDQPSPTGRSVYQDVYEVLKQYAKVPFNVHFYAGTIEEAEKFFSIGGNISFTGVITFAKDYEAVVKHAPLDLIHGETDSPFVAPKPYRGKRCEPWMVKSVYQKIAELKGLPEKRVREQLVANAKNFYNLT
jgi:TatD DNase family protein